MSQEIGLLFRQFTNMYLSNIMYVSCYGAMKLTCMVIQTSL